MVTTRAHENLSPPAPNQLTPGERVRVWQDLLETSEEFLLAGFRRTAKSEAEVLEMYRDWYAKRMLEHDQKLIQMLMRLERSRKSHGG